MTILRTLFMAVAMMCFGTTIHAMPKKSDTTKSNLEASETYWMTKKHNVEECLAKLHTYPQTSNKVTLLICAGDTLISQIEEAHLIGCVIELSEAKKEFANLIGDIDEYIITCRELETYRI